MGFKPVTLDLFHNIYHGIKLFEFVFVSPLADV